MVWYVVMTPLLYTHSIYISLTLFLFNFSGRPTALLCHLPRLPIAMYPMSREYPENLDRLRKGHQLRLFRSNCLHALHNPAPAPPSKWSMHGLWFVCYQGNGHIKLKRVQLLLHFTFTFTSNTPRCPVTHIAVTDSEIFPCAFAC